MASTSRSLRRPWAFVLLFLGSALLLAAQGQPSSAPGAAGAYEALLSPDPELLRIGGLVEPLPLPELERAALLSSLLPARRVEASPATALPPGRLEAYSSKLVGLLDRIAAATEGIEKPAAKAEAALLYLHDERIFRSYAAEATTLSDIFDTGRYNCVSSAVLYLLALKRLGIEALGVRTLDHAFVMVRTGGREIDVETTSPQGFDPGVKKEFTDAFGKVTGFAYVPPGSYGKRWTIGERALVALILSNRSAFLDEGGRYAEALSLGSSLDALMADREGRDFLLDRINNLAADFGNRRDFQAAETLALAASARYGSEPKLDSLLLIASYNRAASLAEARRWKESLDTVASLVAAGRGSPELFELSRGALHNLVGERIAAKDFTGGRAAVAGARSLVGEASAASLLSRLAEAELSEAIRRLPYREALTLVERARAEASLDPKRSEEFLVFLYGSEAARIGAGGDWLRAASLADEGAAKTGRNESLLRAAQTFRRNFVAEAHNRFAALFNARRYAEARAEIEAALKLLPGDPSLAEDLAIVRKALGERP